MLIAPLATAREVTRGTAELVRPPRRVSPSDAAAQFLRDHEGTWNPEMVPMMLEPLDLLSSRQYTGIVYVGPARTGKTMALLLGGICYIVTCAPGDTLMVQMSQDTARDFSRKELDRSIRHSPEMHERLSKRAKDDNTFDKFFRSGMVLKLGWPAVSQLSSKTLKYVFLTDYDRPNNRDNVDGEGPMWDLAFKRIQTYMSRGKCLAEASPGEDVMDPQWRPTTPHEAPPTLGLLSIYNMGSRARWYWKCQHCGQYFEARPGPEAFALPDFEEIEKLVQQHDLMTLAERYARVPCTHCGGEHLPEQKQSLNASGRWLHEGETIAIDGTITGERRRTNIASYWQGGVSAAYQRWDSMLLGYFQAVLTYVRTGDEQPLKTRTNVDFAAPHLPRAIAKRRSAEAYLQRLDNWPRGQVPDGVRFITAAVDVQGNRFVVQWFGWGVGLESWVLDRRIITSSCRPEGDRFAALDPAGYEEDWNVLVAEVIEREFPLAGNIDLTIKPAMVLIDSGGKEGTTTNAYQFWRRLRKLGHGARAMLVKGDGRPNGPRTKMIWPDSSDRKDRKAGGRGDVPVWLLNTNILKDGIAGDLGRDVPGPGYIHMPDWLEQEYFDELTVEVRTEKGWQKERGQRNESFDLHVYGRAACIVLKAESIDWKNPPDWARLPIEQSKTEQPKQTEPAPAQTQAAAPASSNSYLPRRGSYLKR